MKGLFRFLMFQVPIACCLSLVVIIESAGKLSCLELLESSDELSDVVRTVHTLLMRSKEVDRIYMATKENCIQFERNAINSLKRCPISCEYSSTQVISPPVHISSQRWLQSSNVTFIPSQSPTSLTPTKVPSNAPTSSNPTKSPSTSKPTTTPTRSPTSSNPTKSPSTSKPSTTPTRSPTSSNPTKSPSTSKPSTTPTRSPTSSNPTKSPSTSKPTTTPTRSSTSSIPTISPTPLPSSSKPTSTPTTSIPSHAPITLTPTNSPTKSIPTVSPTNSPITSAPSSRPTTSTPTRSPHLSSPTNSPTKSPRASSPTKSPAFICPAGTNSSDGIGSPDSKCQLCPSGFYELLNDTDPTICDKTHPCDFGYWCGSGNTEELHIPVFRVNNLHFINVIYSPEEETSFTLIIYRLSSLSSKFLLANDVPNNVNITSSPILLLNEFALVTIKVRGIINRISINFEGSFIGEKEITLKFTIELKVIPDFLLMFPQQSQFDESLGLSKQNLTIINPTCDFTIDYAFDLSNCRSCSALKINVSSGRLFNRQFQSIMFEIDFSSLNHIKKNEFQENITLISNYSTFGGFRSQKILSIQINLLNPLDLCPPGTFSEKGICFPCPLNTFSSNSGSTACMKCPDSIPLTKYIGSDSSSKCIVLGDQNIFKISQNGSTGLCPLGADCNFVEANVSNLKILPNFWRESNSSLNIRTCNKRKNYCVGNLNSSIENRILRLPCREKHTGPLCEVCVEGFKKRLFSSTCTDSLTNQPDFVFIILIVLCVLLFAICNILLLIYSGPFQLNYEIQRDILILLAFIQVVGGASFVLDVDNFLVLIFNFISLNYLEIFSFPGASSTTQLQKLIIIYVTPCCWLIYQYLVFKVAEHVSSRNQGRLLQIKQFHLNFLYFCVIAIHPGVCMTLLQTFPIDTKFDNNLAYMYYDHSILIYSNDWITCIILASVALFFYALIIPSFFMYQVFETHMHHENLGYIENISLIYFLHQRKPELVNNQILWSSYSQQYYFWYLVEFIRKFIQISCLVMVIDDRELMYFYFLLISTIYLLLLELFQPYIDRKLLFLPVLAEIIAILVISLNFYSYNEDGFNLNEIQKVCESFIIIFLVLWALLFLCDLLSIRLINCLQNTTTYLMSSLSLKKFRKVEPKKSIISLNDIWFWTQLHFLEVQAHYDFFKLLDQYIVLKEKKFHKETILLANICGGHVAIDAKEEEGKEAHEPEDTINEEDKKTNQTSYYSLEEEIIHS